MTFRKGIILAGGTGSRLAPLTLAANKQLLPVYDKPLIYYPLSVLMQAGIRDVLVISGEEDLPRFRTLLGDGSSLNMSFSYVVQPKPVGIPEAFVLGRDFIASDPVTLILGDNIFYGDRLGDLLSQATVIEMGATIFTSRVRDPTQFGVALLDRMGNVVDLVEKPANPVSGQAVTGLYFFDNEVVDLAVALKPSSRGELEILDLQRSYLERGTLNVINLAPTQSWFDAGSADSLLEASNFIAALQQRQGIRIACIEEIAWRNGWIDNLHLGLLGDRMSNSDYGQYLLALARPTKRHLP
jgi:glucose-1-phosphate thymidylyltransferase